MSLINKMLQELDKRHAGQAGISAPRGGPQDLARHVRSVQASRFGSYLFWRVMAGIMILAAAWVIWVMWQITPRSLVTDLAYQSGKRVGSPSGTAGAQPTPATAMANQQLPGAAPPPVAAQPAAPAPAPTPPAAASPAQAPPPARAPEPPPRLAATVAPRAGGEAFSLRLETELGKPVDAQRGRRARARAEPENGAVTEAKSQHKAANAAAAKQEHSPVAKASPAPAQPALKPTVAAAPQRTAPAATTESGSIDKQVGATGRERAEAEFRRAMALVNQGRMAEGMVGLRAALAADPGFETARQTLISLLLESRHVNDAAMVAQEGLAINPGNAGFGILLARISVERGELDKAFTLLKKYESAERNNAEYHAFLAALYQRLHRHREAIDQYQQALRVNPGVGAWWVGLGMSQEAMARQKDAAESFRRAKAAGNLNEDLVSFVDRRLSQLP